MIANINQNRAQSSNGLSKFFTWHAIVVATIYEKKMRTKKLRIWAYKNIWLYSYYINDNSQHKYSIHYSWSKIWLFSWNKLFHLKKKNWKSRNKPVLEFEFHLFQSIQFLFRNLLYVNWEYSIWFSFFSVYFTQTIYRVFWPRSYGT